MVRKKQHLDSIRASLADQQRNVHGGLDMSFLFPVVICYTAATGFGTVGLRSALQSSRGISASPELGKDSRHLHHPPRAKRVIFLFMNGAPSHVDTFDPKPLLADHEGEAPSEDIAGKNRAAGYMPSPFKFSQHGESGIEMSELLPRLSKHADDMCVIRSMHTDVPNHEPGLLLMQSGHQQPTRPSMGSWLSYGLGTENENLPAFVALCPGLPVVGPQLWSSAFLPGQHQGVEVDTNHREVEKLVHNIQHPSLGRTAQKRQLDWYRHSTVNTERHVSGSNSRCASAQWSLHSRSE